MEVHWALPNLTSLKSLNPQLSWSTLLVIYLPSIPRKVKVICMDSIWLSEKKNSLLEGDKTIQTSRNRPKVIQILESPSQGNKITEINTLKNMEDK